MFKSGLSLNSTFPSNYIALDSGNINAQTEIDESAVDKSGAGILVEQNKILSQNFKTIIFLMILGFAANYFLTNK